MWARSIHGIHSLKLPETLKAKIQQVAAKDNTSAHAFMVSTLEREVERRRLRADFIADAMAAAAEVDAGGPVYALDDVHDWIRARICSRSTGEVVPEPRSIRGRGAQSSARKTKARQESAPRRAPVRIWCG